MINPPWKKERKIVVKADAESNPEYGCTPEERSIKDHIRLGVMNIDKPSGPSSHEVVAWIKRILKLKRVGHGGTLETAMLGRSESNRCSTRIIGRVY